jgi:hypothetical protein
MAVAHGVVMKWLKPSIVLTLVFAAGIIVGVGGAHLAVKKIVDEAMKRPEIVAAKIERDLNRKLELTPEQKPKLHEIVMRSNEDLQQLRWEFQPRLGRILKRSEGDIRAMLTETQQKKFDQILKNKPSFVGPQINALPVKAQ